VSSIAGQARLPTTTLGKLFTPICLDADSPRGVVKPGTGTCTGRTRVMVDEARCQAERALCRRSIADVVRHDSRECRPATSGRHAAPSRRSSRKIHIIRSICSRRAAAASTAAAAASRPPARSHVTRSFQYASPRLWNQLPASLRQPRTNLSDSDSPSHSNGTFSIGSIDSPLSSPIHPSLKNLKKRLLAVTRICTANSNTSIYINAMVAFLSAASRSPAAAAASITVQASYFPRRTSPPAQPRRRRRS